MEAQLWKVNWKKKGPKYHFSVVGHPKVFVTAETVDEAIDLLEERITDELHDAVPHLEFIKPLPSAKPDYLFELAGHHRVETVLNVAELFQHPKCRVCDNWSGPRTEALIQLPEKPIGDLDFTWEAGYIVSAKLAKFLSLHECPGLRLRPVVIAGKETMDYLEMWSTHPRPGVAIKGVKASRGGFRCQTCGKTVWMYLPHEAPYFHYLSAESLPVPPRPVFPIYEDYNVKLAVDPATRAAVIKSKRFRGVVTRRVGVLPAGEAVPVDSFFPARET
jgi:hypothetical protein